MSLKKLNLRKQRVSKMSQETESKFNKDIMKEYGWSRKNNFRAVDTFAAEPHNPMPYCITPRHLEGEGMYLDEDRIREAEKRYGAHCGIRMDNGGLCQVPYDDHHSGLIIQCLKEPKNDSPTGKELQAYMKKIMKFPHFKKHGYVGFTLLDSFSKK